MTMRATILLAVSAVLLCLFSSCSTTSTMQPLFTLNDPVGDDHGDGTLRYPLSSDFEKGDLDLVSLQAYPATGGTMFRATFARAIRKPEQRTVDAIGTSLDKVAKLGFYTFNIDIYVDKDNQPQSGSLTSLPGRRVVMDPNHGWERVINVTPDPNAARAEMRRIVSRQLRAKVTAPDSKLEPQTADEIRRQIPADVDLFVYFPNQVTVQGRTIDFFVPDSFLGGTAQPTWSYAVAVSVADVTRSFDLQGTLGIADTDKEDRLMIMPVGTGRSATVLGGAREDDPLEPPLIDIIVPAGMTQEQVLRDYAVHENRMAVLPSITPAKN